MQVDLPVSWRMLLRVLLGLLVPLPLAWVLVAVWSASHTPREQVLTSSGPLEVSPVLSVEARRALLTFERPCARRGECEPPLGCLSFTGQKGFCVASECTTDLQCSDGLTCRLLPTLDQGPRVRLCVAAGRLSEGAPCLALTLDGAESCKAGLVCDSFCGQPCSLDSSSPCPEGFFCRPGPSGPACAPTCENQPCPEGQQCVRFPRGASICAAPVGDDCQRTPCPEGEQCTAAFSPGQPGWAALECERSCDEAQRPCPQGLRCHQGSCQRPCEPQGPKVCGPQRACNTPDSDRDGGWLCGVSGRPGPEKDEALGPKLR